MPPNPQTTAVIIERLDRIQGDICALQGQITKQDEDRHEFRELYIAEQVNARRDIDAAHVAIRENKAAVDKRIEDHEREINILKDAVKPLVWQSRLMTAVLSILGGSVVLLIWQLLTGQAQVIFK